MFKGTAFRRSTSAWTLPPTGETLSSTSSVPCPVKQARPPDLRRCDGFDHRWSTVGHFGADTRVSGTCRCTWAGSTAAHRRGTVASKPTDGRRRCRGPGNGADRAPWSGSGLHKPCRCRRASELWPACAGGAQSTMQDRGRATPSSWRPCVSADEGLSCSRNRCPRRYLLVFRLLLLPSGAPHAGGRVNTPLRCRTRRVRPRPAGCVIGRPQRRHSNGGPPRRSIDVGAP